MRPVNVLVAGRIVAGSARAEAHAAAPLGQLPVQQQQRERPQRQVEDRKHHREYPAHAGKVPNNGNQIEQKARPVHQRCLRERGR